MQDRDRIDLRPIDADPGLAGDQVFAFLGNARFIGAGGEVAYVRADGDTIVKVDIDGDRTLDLQIAIDGLINFAANDFLL